MLKTHGKNACERCKWQHIQFISWSCHTFPISLPEKEFFPFLSWVNIMTLTAVSRDKSTTVQWIKSLTFEAQTGFWQHPPRRQDLGEWIRSEDASVHVHGEKCWCPRLDDERTEQSIDITLLHLERYLIAAAIERLSERSVYDDYYFLLITHTI